MSNPLVNKKDNQSVQQPDMNAMYRQFQENPRKYLANLNIPQNITRPQAMVQYLSDNGRIPPMLQGRVNAMLGRK